MTRTHNAAVLPDGHGALNSSKNLPPWTTLNSSICGASQLADEQSQPRPTCTSRDGPCLWRCRSRAGPFLLTASGARGRRFTWRRRSDWTLRILILPTLALALSPRCAVAIVDELDRVMLAAAVGWGAGAVAHGFSSGWYRRSGMVRKGRATSCRRAAGVGRSTPARWTPSRGSPLRKSAREETYWEEERYSGRSVIFHSSVASVRNFLDSRIWGWGSFRSTRWKSPALQNLAMLENMFGSDFSFGNVNLRGKSEPNTAWTTKLRRRLYLWFGIWYDCAHLVLPTFKL
jgi:hypothetical protein